MRALHVIDRAFRTTTEEQDDAIIWLTRAMGNAGANLTVLLAGHAVHYAVLTRRQPALKLGPWEQSEPADLPADLQGLLASNTRVFAVSEDLAERGLTELPLQSGVAAIDRNAVPLLYEQVDQVWQW